MTFSADGHQLSNGFLQGCCRDFYPFDSHMVCEATDRTLFSDHLGHIVARTVMHKHSGLRHLVDVHLFLYTGKVMSLALLGRSYQIHFKLVFQVDN